MGLNLLKKNLTNRGRRPSGGLEAPSFTGFFIPFRLFCRAEALLPRPFFFAPPPFPFLPALEPVRGWHEPAFLLH
jgi:hypothetical protein